MIRHFKPMKPTLRTILLITAVLLAATLIYFRVTNTPQQDIAIDIVTLAANRRIGVYGPVGLQFDRPMDQASVENHISFTPKTSGRFEWVQNTLWFYPDEPIDPSQDFTLSLRSGAKSAEGEKLNKSLDVSLSIRPTEVLYLVLDQTGGDLWRWDFTAQTATPLTDTGGTIIDFAPNRIGEAIVYSAENVEGGSDLWVTDREAQTNTLIIECGLDYCSQPAWSADSALIAYARQSRNTTTGLLQSPQIWLYNTESLEAHPLYPDEDIKGELPSFSPEGQRLAFYNLDQSAIQILNLEASQETLIPTDVEGMGDWSPDGSQMLFTDLVPSALEPEEAIYIADLEDRSVRRALEESSEGTVFSQPRVSPDGDWIAVSLRPVNSTGSKALWVLELDGDEITLIANEPAETYTSYFWSPSGYRLIYQSLDTSNASFPSAIWLWHWGRSESELIVENAARPVWLP